MLIYRDGSVQVNHGGAEMGQGLHTKIQQIAAESLGVDLEAVRVMPTRTDKIPNTSATAASAGADLNGAAVADACSQLRSRLAEVAAVLLELRRGGGRFSHGSVFPDGEQQRAIPFAQVCEAAYRQRVPLFAQGYYSTPDIHYDPQDRPGRAVPLFRLWRGGVRSGSGRLHRRLSSACEPTSWKTSAIRFRRWSIAGRSKADSFKASAG